MTKIIRITVDNVTMTKEQALKDAAECHDQCGIPVEVQSTLGDPIAYFVDGKDRKSVV